MVLVMLEVELKLFFLSKFKFIIDIFETIKFIFKKKVSKQKRMHMLVSYM